MCVWVKLVMGKLVALFLGVLDDVLKYNFIHRLPLLGSRRFEIAVELLGDVDRDVGIFLFTQYI